MLNEKEIYEASPAEFKELTGRRYKVRLIEGDRLGSTGYYPAEMLKQYGPKVFVKGTPMYLDHMSEAEKAVRPHGSVMNYAAELAEDAYYENDGLYADIEVFEHQIPLIKSLKDKIGISIRARGNVTEQIINGQRVPVFQNFTLARSADFVVKAGAGGKIVEMVEQAMETESEAVSEEQEKENMDQEILDALKGIKEAQEQLAEAIANIGTAEVVTVEEAARGDLDALEIAEALATSSLDADGRRRVLDLHRANGKPLAELIEAEEAYVKKAVEAAESARVDIEGVETDAEETAVETKTAVRIPRAWAVK